jgi:hypothetical protein
MLLLCSNQSYCSSNLEAGFKLLQNGHSIGEASKLSGVPKTTLYNKARNCGVLCPKDLKKYSNDVIEQAVKAVAGKNTIYHVNKY